MCAIANRIVSQEGEVSLIERDLLLEDLRQLYDVALQLGVSAQEQPVVSPEEHKETRQAMPDEEILSSTVMATMAAMSVPTPEPEPAEETQRAASHNDSMPVEEPQRAAPLQTEPEVASTPEPEEEDRREAVVEEPVSPVEPEHKAPGTQASLLDYLKRPVEEKPTVRTLGEKLGEKKEESVQREPLAKKVTDLRTVININDKFSFMSELFHNNMKAYNDFILRLNAIDTRDEALLCVNEVSAQYRWDEASLAVQAFYKVFDKKF